jgi:hypothetical protein
MTAETVSRWARGFVAGGVCWLVAGLAGQLLGATRRTTVALLLFGFVLHVVFGKAYSLVPTYFDRTLAAPRAPALHLPLALVGVAGLALGGTGPVLGGATELALGGTGIELSGTATTLGAVSWTLGVCVFLGTLAWTIRDNLTGAETGTGEAKAHRRTVDRLANATVPVALLYLAAGSYATLAAATPLPPLIDGYPPRASHLLAAGTAALMLFSLGFRLLPRFLTADPPQKLVPVVLVPGALGPALLAVGLPHGPLLHVGATLETIAVVTFAVVYLRLFRQSDRPRIGLYGVLAGVGFGVCGVTLGFLLAVGGATATLVATHFRLTLLGFLGLSVVGVSYQFYPPAAGTFRGASDRTAALAMACLALGVTLRLGSGLTAWQFGTAVLTAGFSETTALTLPPVLRISGDAVALLGGIVHAGLILGLFTDRYWT